MVMQQQVPQFLTIALFGKYGSNSMIEPLRMIANFLVGKGCRVLALEETATQLGLPFVVGLTVKEIGAQANAAIVVGGDGTFIGVARQFVLNNIPLIGINHGRLGFLTDIALSTCLEELSEILDGNYTKEARSLLQSKVMRGDQVLASALAFNDVVVSRGTVGGVIDVRVSVDGHYMCNQRGDGLIVSTPTGSTAYALSANGPILHPQVWGILLVPVAPHTLTNRPIVLSEKSKIEIVICGGRDTSVHFDMHSLQHLEVGDKILIERAATPVQLLHPRSYNYFDMLRNKLHWSAMPNADYSTSSDKSDRV
jgi:NAD+ kinase